MEMRTWLLIGGGVAALAAGALVFTSRANASPPAEVTGLPSYFPPMVSGLGGGSIDPGGLNAQGSYGTDTSIASLIASNLSIAQLQSSTTLESARIEKDVALAGYANELAVTKERNTGAVNLQSVINAGQQAIATITGTNQRELAKVSGANEQALAQITGSNAVALTNAQGSNALTLQQQMDTTALLQSLIAKTPKKDGNVSRLNLGGTIYKITQ